MGVDGILGCLDVFIGLLLLHEVAVKVGRGEIVNDVALCFGGEAPAQVVEEI